MNDSPASETVLVHREGHVMVITLNRPRVYNCIDVTVHCLVGAALEEAEADRTVRAVILTGAGDKAFCAGADLKAVSRGESLHPEDPVQKAWGFAGYVRHPIGKPTIAAVNGFALGGGTELTLASDLAIASQTATFGLPEVKRGIIAGAGGAFRILAQVPRKRAMEILLTGDPLTASQALELGLVNAVVPPGQLMDAALALAARITVNAPLSVQASKRIALGIANGGIEDEAALWALSEAEWDRLIRSDDAREGPLAFAEKRQPLWQGR